MKIRKSIGYAYPTSERAQEFAEVGEPAVGGYYIQHSVQRKDGSWSGPYPAHGVTPMTYQSATDPDMLEELLEVDGEWYWRGCQFSLASELLIESALELGQAIDCVQDCG